jgi:hypothetical protein
MTETTRLTPSGHRLCIAAASESVVPEGASFESERFGEPTCSFSYRITSSAMASSGDAASKETSALD